MIKTVPTRHARVGMYLSAENERWVPAGARGRRGLITRPQSIEQILELGVEEIYIDTERGLDSEYARPLPAPPAPPDAELRQQEQSGVRAPTLPFSTVGAATQRLHQETLSLVGDVMHRVKNHQELDIGQLETAADEIVDSIFQNPHELSCLSRIRSKDAYLLEHSLNVGVLIALFGRYLLWDRARLRQAAVGGILHDIGKVLVPAGILNKPGKLTADEWEEMKNHVNYGYETLRHYADMDPIVLSVCRQHHERLDGSGYPRGLDAARVDRFGRIAAVCDVYDAITADRVYHRGMSPTLAMKRMLEWSDNHLDRDLVYQFIRCLSIYPEGTRVRLSDQREAVVIKANPRHHNRPCLRVYFSPEQGRLDEPVDLDLDRPGVGASIVSALEPDETAVPTDLRQLF